MKSKKDLENFYNKSLMDIRDQVENTRDEVNSVIEDTLYHVLETIMKYDNSDLSNLNKIKEELSLKMSNA